LLPESIDFAFNQLDVSEQTKGAAESCKKRVQKIIIDLRYQDMQLKDIKTRHVRKILNTCSKKYDLSPHSFNHYRAYLLMFFKILLREDAIEYNPVLSIEKQVPLKKLRNLLTDDERKKINDHFKSTDIYFYRFIHCFFHSGARPVELLRLKKEQIDLSNCTYKVVVKKGKLNEEQLRPIKLIALDFWQAQYDETMDGNYLFGSCLKPTHIPGTRDYITKKWQREVKRDLGISKDLYSLKHLNLDETAAILNADDASAMAGHTSTVVTMKHYLVNEKQRTLERLKKVNNSFS
jgi:integrase